MLESIEASDSHVPRVGACLRKNGELYIFSKSRLRGIANVETEPFIRSTVTESANILGSHLLEAKLGSLSFFERVNPNKFVPPYFEWAGVKNYSQFAKHTKSVSIDFFPEYIEFSPSRNERGTWFGMPDDKSRIPVTSTPAKIGEQLLKSFEVAVA